ncbi:hypothetical protein HCN51_30105 [Nonomuraea sp. FMUSA5-5]|uniref:Uncharacterized protein n=1 Tax=Nonomuraea composti TaxID=2720023 RepID=A0ABX1BD04_9ACTN|nr:hypothetical protein [Nonomuraea sp. FMUSA5-5]NJP93646.1 hypothetical protein [Nonomuraea sp. FMUSA5-5]
MLRYRLGPILIAALAVLVAASGAAALLSGDARLLLLLVYGRYAGDPDELDTDHLLMLVLVGLVRVWGLWQLLPKRHDGSGGRPGADERWLRITLYVWALCELTDRLPWVDLPEIVVWAAAVVLLYRVMRGVSRSLRLVALVVGLLQPVRALAHLALEPASIDAEILYRVLPLGGVTWLLWLVLTLVAQAKDGRWRRGTLWAGAAVAAAPVLVPDLSFPFSPAYIWGEGAGLVIEVITAVWLGRSAREAGNPPRAANNATPPSLGPRVAPPEPHDTISPSPPSTTLPNPQPATSASPTGASASPPSTAPPRPHSTTAVSAAEPRVPPQPHSAASTSTRPPASRSGTALSPQARGGAATVRLRWWPVQVVAVVLPLVPAVVNCVDGVFTWVGPRGPVASWFDTGGWFLRQLWLPLDILVGIGGAAGLVLAAVLVRTPRLVLGTAGVLLVAAVVGAVSGVVGPSSTLLPDSALYESPLRGVPIFPDQMLSAGPGISPLWYSATFTASALLLLLAHGGSPRRRRPYQTVVASAATAAVLAFVPPSDQAPGRFTTASDCEAADPRMSGEQRFVCAVRRIESPPFGKEMPDERLIAYGRRLCGVYTRGDLREAAEFRAAHGVAVLDETALLGDICPKARADVDAAVAEEEAEMLAWEAEEQAQCDRAPRHRPLIEPVRATREKEPVWPEVWLEAYEEEGIPDDGAYEQDLDLVATSPGRLLIEVDTTYRVCVTTETYDRRPPVETKGWEHVVEVGYDSPTGSIVLTDNLAGVELPDLALRGRKGHYRIRVHYDPPDWEKRVGQRLLVMAWPGRGDDRVVHRAAVQR